MKIKLFRIKNYRSIKDSDTCYLSGDNITILAGKNETGKTAILEALEDFGVNKEIRKEAIPYHNPEAIPEISITFEVYEGMLKEISKEIDYELKTNKSVDIEIIKKYPAEYSISEKSKEVLEIGSANLLNGLKREIKDIYAHIKRVHWKIKGADRKLPEINFDDTSKSKADFAAFTNEINSDSLSGAVEDKEVILSGIAKITENFAVIDRLENLWEKFINEVKKWIPNFILFISFEDVFPSELTLAEAVNNELIKDLAVISDLDLGLIKSESIAFKTKHKEQLNLKLKEDYKKFWTQDFTNLHIEWDSEKLYFLIKEDEDFYPPSLRSKGKQWHLAFYVRVAARAREDVPNIILIDEPGLFLHAKAQKDILRRLEDSAKGAPIIFCTHSPYLIKIDELSRIRLISRTTRKGTLISNKIHKGADKETLTPIITAIGLDLSIGLDIAKDNNVILEGITDYYYLSAFEKILNFSFNKETHLIPSVGADKFNFLVPLMIGWGLNYCCVLDNDDKGRRIEKKLLGDFEQAGVKTMFVSKGKDEEIEDLFDKEDFVKFVLNEKSKGLATDKKNSEIIKQKDKNYDKVLLSKLFLEKTKNESVPLTEKTKDNFKNLLKEINELMFSKA